MMRRPSAEEIGRLYDEYGASLYRYALMILADPEAAADAVQQVFLTAVRSVRLPPSRNASADHRSLGGGGQPDRNPIRAGERYMRRAVRNECFTVLRKRQREEPSAVPLLVPAGADNPALRLTMEQALRALPPDQREVVHLKVFEGLTFQEIADMIDESINTVASRYRYAIEKLRAQMMVRS